MAKTLSKVLGRADDPRKSGDEKVVTLRKPIATKQTQDPVRDEGEDLDPEPKADESVFTGSDDKFSNAYVTVMVPQKFTLTADDGVPVKYEVGIQDMPRSHATHWFSKVQGVEIHD